MVVFGFDSQFQPLPMIHVSEYCQVITILFPRRETLLLTPLRLCGQNPYPLILKISCFVADRLKTAKLLKSCDRQILEENLEFREKFPLVTS